MVEDGSLVSSDQRKATREEYAVDILPMHFNRLDCLQLPLAVLNRPHLLHLLLGWSSKLPADAQFGGRWLGTDTFGGVAPIPASDHGSQYKSRAGVVA